MFRNSHPNPTLPLAPLRWERGLLTPKSRQFPPYLPLRTAGQGTGITGIKGIKTVIPGHSAVTNWQAFVDYGEFIRSFVTSVQASAKAGKTAEQAVTDFVPAAKFKDYNMGRAKANVELIYKETKQ